jgi:hypothetical protein
MPDYYVLYRSWRFLLRDQHNNEQCVMVWLKNIFVSPFIPEEDWEQEEKKENRCAFGAELYVTSTYYMLHPIRCLDVFLSRAF